MRRLIIVALVVAWCGVAAAGPTRKVAITTTPAGATVYLSSKENGPVCTTPCTIDAPLGDTPIIVELEGRESVIESLSVPKGKAPLKVSYELKAAVGTIKVDGPKGAKVMIGGEDKGTAPTEIEVDAGQYVVVLSLGGKQIDSIPVDVEAGGEVSVTGTGKPLTGGGGDPPPGGGGDIVKPARPPRTAPYLRASVLVDVGIRDFTYENVQTTMTLNDEQEPGVVLVGPALELYLGNLLGVRALRGLSIAGRFQYGVNKLDVTGGGIVDPTTTYWDSLEASLRHRWMFGAFGIEVGAGYVQDWFQFNGTEEDVALLPDTQYQSVKLGGRASYAFGKYEPYLAFENRIVVGGGVLEQRFQSASTSGVRAAVGAQATFGALGVRLEGSLTRYSWSFTFDSMDERKADGAVDAIKQIALSISYAY